MKVQYITSILHLVRAQNKMMYFGNRFLINYVDFHSFWLQIDFFNVYKYENACFGIFGEYLF